MVLILGQKNDGSTIDVAEWLLYYGKEFLILYTEDINFQIKELDLLERKFIVIVNNNAYNLYDVSSVWNRRLGISPNLFTNKYLDYKNPEDFFMEKGDRYHYNQLSDESRILFEFIHYLVEKESVLSIGSFFSNRVNKLIVLDKAQKCGLKIPPTYIFTRKESVCKLKESNRRIITKPMCEEIYRPDVKKEYMYFSNVERITNNDINQFSTEFYPSLVQVEIDKVLEIRILYFQNAFYPMAIFSQDEKAAKVDYRKNPHHKTPLKCVPYKLPKEIETSLFSLMEELKLNTGSIDMILNKDLEYVFLEVNPCGQYTMTSSPCNYYIDKKIAELL